MAWSFWIALIFIVGFLGFQILKLVNTNRTKLEYKVKKVLATNETGPDSFGKRIKRGFGVMNDKLKNSDLVKGIQQEQSQSSFKDMLPTELVKPVEVNEEKDKKKETKATDPFSTDLNNLGKLDF